MSCSPGTAQIGPSAHQVLDALAASIARSYPRQRITVEAHTDSGNLYGGAFSNQVQLGHAQSQAVIDQLVRRNQLPAQQMSAVSHGPNYPRADNATAAGRAENRRIECVIYPAGF
ncbi:MAG: OmpA family protein [Pirellulales bacterium]